jgi:hypothetical protein
MQDLANEIERLNRNHAANTHTYVTKRVNLMSRYQKEYKTHMNLRHNSQILLEQMARSHGQTLNEARHEHMFRRRHAGKVIYRKLRNWRHRPGGPVYQRLMGEATNLERPRPQTPSPPHWSKLLSEEHRRGRHLNVR